MVKLFRGADRILCVRLYGGFAPNCLCRVGLLWVWLRRLLRVFQLVPGVAERDVLVPLCAALQRRVSQLKPADLQLLLSDFSAIYTAQFLPFFSAAARVLKQCCQEALEPLPAARQPEGQQVHEVAETATGGFNNKIKSNSSSHWVKAPNHRKEWLSPLQACFLLHALGKL